MRLLLMILLCVACVQAQTLRNQILCSDQRTGDVMVMKADGDWSQPESILWIWKPKDDPAIGAERAGAFGNPSDTKAVAGGTQILAVASGGGVALIDVATKRSVFTAYPGGNTHSADLLPDGTIITASSTGNALKVFTRIGTEPTPHKTFTLNFESAHGVVWDQIHGLVWGLGKDGVGAFRYNFDKEDPQLVLVQMFKLGPKTYWGHDLILLEKENKLLMTGANVQELDTMTGQVKLFNRKHSVKSISIHPKTGEQLVQIPNEKWWNDTLQLLNGERTWTFPKARFYKARWFAW